MDRPVPNDAPQSIGAGRYPAGFLQNYEPIECLAHNEMGETLLVRQFQSGAYYVAKCYTDRSLFSRTTEGKLLSRLRHPGLPRLADVYQDGAALCVVREYVSGTPLHQAFAHRPCGEQQAMDIGRQLCAILTYLHGQVPPVIHRDIKPQNVILDSDGKISLIDFGISRVYDPSAPADTVAYGTQEFAPPEQYGFAQSDGRTDIFSLGVLLRWLLTGATKLTDDAGRVKNRRLERIIRKCTAFAPKDRYRDAEAVRRALRNADGRRQRLALQACCALLSLSLALTAGFVLGRFTDVRPVIFYGSGSVTFKEPLIERAVRLQLGKTSAEAIRTEELDRVTELYLYHDQAIKTAAEFYALCADGGQPAEGTSGIASLRDIARLRRLSALYLAHQPVSDISPLEKLRQLTYLELRNCAVADLSPIARLPQLTCLSLSDCAQATDLSPLAHCVLLRGLVLSNSRAKDFSALTGLGELEYLHLQGVDPERFLPYLRGHVVRQLHLGFVSMDSLAVLAEVKGLQELMLDQMRLASLAGVEQLADLTDVIILGMPELDLAPLKALPHLRKLTVSESMRAQAQSLGTKVEIRQR